MDIKIKDLSQLSYLLIIGWLVQWHLELFSVKEMEDRRAICEQ